ncbi:unnamed protein product [Acanthoscelides obtectus]|uniref:Uncharacterized protein n=1 Tax=Acanthoscelides obtectus TaxID=200917 RepID=A0A9P0JN81_ACAOB|nr:unnamed protein product [Acanthoscelides obtectus]CAK1628932.1 hypothetical protein AOBTE_LOCUS5472 [Acanthoscelides obtectus]
MYDYLKIMKCLSSYLCIFFSIWSVFVHRAKVEKHFVNI